MKKKNKDLKITFKTLKGVMKSKVDLSIKMACMKDLDEIYNTAINEDEDKRTLKKIKKYLDKNIKKYNYKEYKEEDIPEYIMEDWK